MNFYEQNELSDDELSKVSGGICDDGGRSTKEEVVYKYNIGERVYAYVSGSTTSGYAIIVNRCIKKYGNYWYPYYFVRMENTQKCHWQMQSFLMDN